MAWLRFDNDNYIRFSWLNFKFQKDNWPNFFDISLVNDHGKLIDNFKTDNIVQNFIAPPEYH